MYIHIYIHPYHIHKHMCMYIYVRFVSSRCVSLIARPTANRVDGPQGGTLCFCGLCFCTGRNSLRLYQAPSTKPPSRVREKLLSGTAPRVKDAPQARRRLQDSRTPRATPPCRPPPRAPRAPARTAGARGRAGPSCSGRARGGWLSN